MLGCNAQKIAIVSHLFNTGAIACLVTALLTNQWLLTEERIPDLTDSAFVALSKAGIKLRNITYAVRHTQSGMWTFCQQDPNQVVLDCFWIDHHVPDHSDVDPRNATTCILYATMISMPSLLSAASVTLVGMVTNALIKFRKIWIFVTGIIYIVAGICTFTCIVLFITYVIQELEHKEEEKGVDGDAIFSATYGYSTFLAMISFCCQELGGIALIYLSVSRFNKHWAEKDRRQEERQRQLQPSQSFSLAGSLQSDPAVIAHYTHRDFYLLNANPGLNHHPHNDLFPSTGRNFNSATWNGRLADHQVSISQLGQLRSLSANVSPVAIGMTRKCRTWTVPDLNVRSHDVYVGNHVQCSYDNSAFMTPFPLAIRKNATKDDATAYGTAHLVAASGSSPQVTRYGPNHQHYQLVPTSSNRQVTFSSTLPSQSQTDQGLVDLPASQSSFRKNQSKKSAPVRRNDNWRMTPV